MKNRFKRFLSVTTAAVTGTLIACICLVWSLLSDGAAADSGTPGFPYAVLPEILSIGVLAGGYYGAGPAAIRTWSNREGMMRLTSSLCAGYGICTGVRIFLRLVHSEFFWRSGNVSDQCSGLFFHVCAELSGISKRRLNEMNQKLKEYHEKTADLPGSSS